VILWLASKNNSFEAQRIQTKAGAKMQSEETH
jgi:hypothetical protein